VQDEPEVPRALILAIAFTDGSEVSRSLTLQ
jgi:hypothetical protein